jgi:hypothetical protein
LLVVENEVFRDAFNPRVTRISIRVFIAILEFISIVNKVVNSTGEHFRVHETELRLNISRKNSISRRHRAPLFLQ